MRVISKKRLKDFWLLPGRGAAKGPLQAWHTLASSKKTVWTCWADLKCDYPAADIVGDCVVFNIGGNKYRLIARLRYPVFVYVLKVMTHAEYDKIDWQRECGCHRKPKRKSKAAKKKGPK